MPDDNRPKITRTTSLFPGAKARGSARLFPAARSPFVVDPRSGASTGVRATDPRTGEGPYTRVVRQAQEAARRSASGGRSFGGTFGDAASSGPGGVLGGITANGQTDITTNMADNQSLFGPLDLPNPDDVFLFDRGAPINPETGGRSGLLQSRGVYGSADSLERQLPAGQTVKSGSNENRMTIAAGILWLRNLAARDGVAYNKLVVLLRNAGYGNLPSNDAELPLNGYSQQVGVAFALAANDLAQAGQGGDNRTLLEYLNDRGKSYADFLAQEEADRAQEQAYDPIERQYQDPATLRATAKQAAVQALGRALTDEEEARFEAAFRAREDTFYDAIDKARESEGVFRGYSPDVGGQVDSFLDGPEFETEAAANRISGYADVFLNMMGGSPG